MHTSNNVASAILNSYASRFGYLGGRRDLRASLILTSFFAFAIPSYAEAEALLPVKPSPYLVSAITRNMFKLPKPDDDLVLLSAHRGSGRSIPRIQPMPCKTPGIRRSRAWKSMPASPLTMKSFYLTTTGLSASQLEAAYYIIRTFRSYDRPIYGTDMAAFLRIHKGERRSS